jgi:crotonobetainyl-CoA:carnitine CoA-transferase CaiB-like acyl-CoA transferase
MRTSFGAPETGGAKTMEGKESLAVDLQTEEGRRIVREVAARADVFVNGFRPGVAERMGLGYDDLSALNPALVYVHAAGYGADGPLSSRPIYAQVAQAVAGSIGRYAGRWLDPELTRNFSWFEAQVVILPRLRGPVDGDANAALAVLTSVLLGLYHQRRTGQGQFLSTTMIGGNAWAYADDFVRYEGKPELPAPDEENHGLGALYRLYPAASGWVFLAAPRQQEWEALVAALDRPELAADPRFADAAARAANDDALVQLLGQVFATGDAARWEETLTAQGIACVEAFGASASEFTCTDPVMRDTGLVVEVEHPLFGPILRHAPVIRFSETPARVAPGCLVGQHTEQVLREAGYDDRQIADLVARQVVFARAGDGA